MTNDHWARLNEAEQGEPFVGKGTWSEYLSNFYEYWIVVDGYEYRTVEHYYQAMKTLDAECRDLIRIASTPGEAKLLGRKAPLRTDWEFIKYDVMLKALREKFRGEKTFLNSFLRDFSGPIVEWNTWHDRIWGVCTCSRCGKTGQNLLGKALEQIRREILNDDE